MKKEDGILSEVSEEDLDLLEEDSEEFWKDVKVIGSDAFTECETLESIEIKDSVEVVEAFAFYGCSDLKKIRMSKNLKRVSLAAFSDTGIEEVTWLDGVQELSEDIFNSCKNLKTIIIPSTVKKISKRALLNCTKLENVKLEEGLQIIEAEAFNMCISLKNISIPTSTKIIKEKVFTNCDNLKVVSIPSNVQIEKYAFPCKDDYEQIYFYDLQNILSQTWIEPFLDANISTLYKNEKTGQYLLQNNDIKKSEEGFTLFSDLDEYIEKCKCSSKAASICYEENFKVAEIKEKLISKELLNEVLSRDNINKFKKIETCLEFNSMIKRINKKIGKNNYDLRELFVFAYNLGSFDSDSKVRQKACNFIENLFDKGLLNEDNASYIFEAMSLDGYNKEWSEFIMNKDNTKILFDKDLKKADFISKTYNNFAQIKRFNTSNKGEQREKKVTIEACEKYLDIILFDHVSDTTKDIVPIISEYTREQESFDNARAIREKYLDLRKNGKISDHILKEELKEQDVFDEIDKLKETLLKDINKTIDSLNELSNKKFTYEFLSKYDPKNFVLGKYCSCCSHLEGTGYGIMEASILHPYCQNLVIKNKYGQIVAKSTIYVNKEQGYAVYNNVEINKSCIKEDRKFIYKKYKEATEKFVCKYNEINKDKPIKQVNVGMHLNDLMAEIRNNNEKGEILEGIDFSIFGKEENSYGGDWKDEQYIMWKKK